MQALRGRETSMISRNPRGARGPIRPVGRRIVDVLPRHGQATRGDARARAIQDLEPVCIVRAAGRCDASRFELSGGLLQGAVIAIVPACRPRLPIADAPTIGLDATQPRPGCRAAAPRRVIVMREGRIVGHGRVAEQGRVVDVLGSPGADCTRDLLAAIPRPA